MTDALHVIPEETTVETGVEKTAALASGLADILADTYRLVFKTHAYHWNVEGPLFYSVHNLTEAQYTDMFAAADELAERIRALGHLAPMSMVDITAMSRVEDRKGRLSAGDMIEDLARDHEKVAHRLHDLATMAGDANDIVTEDLATARSAFHEKAAWMLRALSAG